MFLKWLCVTGAVAYVCLCLGEFVVQKDWMLASKSIGIEALVAFLV